MKNIQLPPNIIGPKTGQGQNVEDILRSLPEWFGIEQAIIEYKNKSNSLPTWLATDNKQVTGCISILKHFSSSYEIYVMGIKKDYQRNGIGKRLIETVANYCKQNGGKYLQVKTLSQDRECFAYAKTRKFYIGMGFEPIEVFPLLWDAANPCLLMIKQL